MPLWASAHVSPYLRSLGHSSGGTNSTLGQPRATAVSQMRSISQLQGGAFRHQYASDCRMRPCLTVVSIGWIRSATMPLALSEWVVACAAFASRGFVSAGSPMSFPLALTVELEINEMSA